jgi:DNA-binding LytR/AlgR family response regulator
MARIGRVTGPYATAITVVALLFAATALILAAANRHPGVPLLAAGALLEALLVVFAIGGVVQMIGSGHDFARAEFVGYLLGCVAIPPMAFIWAWGEKSRAGAFVVALAFLITPVMILRVQQVWAGPLG